jgi:hypothetical protein
MVKSPEDRQKKYAAKFDAEVVRSRYSATADLAKAGQTAASNAMAAIASAVRAILNDAGEYPIVTSMYMSFANKLYGICRKFAGYPDAKTLSTTATNTALLEISKWKDMGAKDQILKDIWNIFAACLGSPPSPIP